MGLSSPKEFQIPPDWVYRGEGNCNVVISLPSQGKILRIRKIEKPTSLLGWFLVWIKEFLNWYCGNPLNEESRDIKFYKNIIRPLFGKEYVCDAEQVFLSKKQMRILSRDLRNKRPEHRKHKKLQHGRAALFQDYAFLPKIKPSIINDTFAIEIKPKQGWVPFNDKQFSNCIYCMNQYLKVYTNRCNYYVMNYAFRGIKNKSNQSVHIAPLIYFQGKNPK